ncbi:dehydrogenase/reductase SDR family member 7 isoform X2 [Hyalella azteca]|uniref:Dehydrogenase/reductase SDR family member 7 isoform X2 n=1 Tax=Hyalella azteca TaxID=294128 RepID=A0A8B7NM04_HYAAZ|nr:dehydrogenase/reductase SDR family member 7 isoform X2 [Hyalella azteca]
MVAASADADFVLFLLNWFLPDSSNKLQGQVIWITGASRGIGEAYAIVLAKSGAKLALSARDEQRLQQVKQKCLDAGAREEDILLVPLDMVKYEDHEQAFNKVLQYFGKVSVLLNNAGRSQRARWDDIELSVDKELFELNVFSLVALARRVNKYFRTVGGGHHVVTSSTLGKFGGPNSASYTASKHALHGYFESLRVEGLKDNISVTMLCPGPVESELLQHAFTEKLGQGVSGERSGRRMSAMRCAHLSATAIAYKLPEAWVVEQPVLLLQYTVYYLPYVAFR